jgi:hypothetical protein
VTIPLILQLIFNARATKTDEMMLENLAMTLEFTGNP